MGVIIASIGSGETDFEYSSICGIRQDSEFFEYSSLRGNCLCVYGSSILCYCCMGNLPAYKGSLSG